MSTLPPWMKNKPPTANNTPQPPSNPTPPANQSGGNTGGSLPPWMKNKQGGQGNPPATQAPPPPQNNNPLPASNPVNTSGGSNTGGNVPPWMAKNKVANNTQGPPQGGKPPLPATNSQPAAGGNIPPWMKNKQQGSQPASGNATQREADNSQISSIPKNTEQQSKEGTEQKVIQELKQNEPKESQNKQEIEQQQQQDKSNKKTKTTKNKPKKASSPKKLASSVKKLPNLNNHFHKYITSLNLSCSKDQQYPQKIEHQKTLIKNIIQFSSNATEKLKQYLKQRKVTQRKKNFIAFDDFFILYGLVQGLSADDKIIFKTKNIQNNQLFFRIYQNMFNATIKLMKKIAVFRLRVPLLARIQYKGIQFVCQGICDELTDVLATPAQNYQQISAQMNQLEKQLREIGLQSLDRKCFLVKKLQLQGQQIFVLYLNENIQAAAIMKNYIPILQIDKFTNLQNLAAGLIPLNYSQIKKIKELKTTLTNQHFIEYIQCFQLAHAIRVVYSSCQGQVDENSFWSLVFDEKQQIWSMISKAYQNIFSSAVPQFQSNKLLIAHILQIMLPLKFNHSNFINKYLPKSQKSSPSKIKTILHSYEPRQSTYYLQNLQIIEICSLFDKYANTPDKMKLAQQSLDIQKYILSLKKIVISQQNKEYREVCNNNVNDLTVLKNQVNLLIRKKMYKNAIKVLEERLYGINDTKQVTSKKKGQKKKYQNTLEKTILHSILMMISMILTQEPDQQDTQKNQQDKIKSQETKQAKQEKGQENNNNQGQQKKPEKQEQPKQNEEKQEAKNYFGSKGENSSEKSNSRPSSAKQKPKAQDNYQLKMLKQLSHILQLLSLFFPNQNQIWYHIQIYTMLGSYYSKKVSQVNQPSHPEQTIKFIQHAYELSIQYYGPLSLQTASLLYEKGSIYYNLQQYQKSMEFLESAMKIFKSSSKNSRNICECMFIIGRCHIQIKQIQEGRQILQKVAAEYIILGQPVDAVSVYQCLYMLPDQQNKAKMFASITPSVQYNPQQYLEKQAQVALNFRISPILKKIIKRVLKVQIRLYSKDKIKVLTQIAKQNLKNKQQNTQDEQTIQQIMLEIEQSMKNSGNFIQMIRWSLSVLWVKNDKGSSQWQRATEIIQRLLSLFNEKEIQQITNE